MFNQRTLYINLILFLFFQGKFIRINFDASGYIAGANIETCILFFCFRTHAMRLFLSFKPAKAKRGMSFLECFVALALNDLSINSFVVLIITFHMSSLFTTFIFSIILFIHFLLIKCLHFCHFVHFNEHALYF